MILQDKTFVSNPLISVNICCFNQEATIGQTLDSILMQDFMGPFEIVIGEDASKDNTAAICRQYQERYPNKIKLLLHETNLGMAENLKATIAASSGKYMAFCAGDDYWIHERKLSMQYAFMEENVDCGLVHTGFNVLHVTDGIIEEGKFDTDVTDTSNLLVNGNFIMALTVMTYTELMKEAVSEGILDQGFLMEDFPLWLYVTEKKKLGYINDITVVWRKNDESLSNTRSELKALYIRASGEDVRSYFAERSGRTEEIRQVLIQKFKSMQYYAFAHQNREIAVRCLSRLKTLNAVDWRAYLYCYPSLQRLSRLKQQISKSMSRVPGLF